MSKECELELVMILNTRMILHKISVIVVKLFILRYIDI